MATLAVSCRLDPFATIEVRDQSGEVLATGTGELVVDLPPGDVEVWATAAGRDVTRRVQVDDEDVAVELDLGAYPSAAPTAGTSTDVDGHAGVVRTMSEDLAHRAGGGAAVGLVVRRWSSDDRAPLRVELSTEGTVVRLAWHEPDDLSIAVTSVVVPPGSYVLTIDDDQPTSLVVPAWAGWQTLVFLPVSGTGIAASMTVMHTVPSGATWEPALPLVVLLDRLHWALLERPIVTDGCLRALHRQFGPHLGASPLVHLLLGAVVATGQGEESRAQLRSSLTVLDLPTVTAVVPTDVTALRLVSGSDEAVAAVHAPPLLARSADVLLAGEQRRPGTIRGAAIDAFATRVASPLWFRWSAGAATTAAGDAAYDDDAFRAALVHAVSVVREEPALDPSERDGAATRARLLAYVHDEARRRNHLAADVLATSGPAALVRGTGLPAIGVVEALRSIGGGGPPIGDEPSPPRPPEPPARRPVLAIGLVVAVVIAVAVWLWRSNTPDDDDDERGSETTLELPTTTTTTPVDPTSPVLPTSPVEPNRPPTADGARFEALADVALTTSVTGSDPEGAPLTYRLVDGPEAGQLYLRADGSFSYVPGGRSGDQATFAFVVSDGVQDSPPASVVIDVLPGVTAEPVVVAEEAGVVEVVLSLSGPTQVPVEVEVRPAGVGRTVRATPGADYVPVDTVVGLLDGATSEVTIELELIDDDEPEETEPVVLEVIVRHSGPAQPVELTVALLRDGDQAVVIERATVPFDLTDLTDTTEVPP